MLFLLIWALLWSVPPLHRQNRRAVENAFAARENLWEGLLPTDAQVESAYERAPDDPFLAAQHLQNLPLRRSSRPGDQRQFFREYDALLRRFPDRLDLRRQRLIRSTSGNIVSMPYTMWFEKGAPGHKPPPFVWPAMRPLDGAEVAKVAQVARAGENLAPDDAFFPWMEAMATWNLKGEARALRALERAGRCDQWNDGTLDEARQKLDFAGQRQTLEWQQRFFVMLSVLLPHYAGMHGITREVTLSGVAKYRAGDQAEAWRRWAIALRAARAVRRGESSGRNGFWMGVVLGENLETMVWNLVATEIGGAPSADAPGAAGASPAQKNRRDGRSLAFFETLARRDGHGDLAAWSAREWRGIEARRSDPRLQSGADAWQIDRSRWPWFSRRARWTLQLDWVGARAMVLAASGALLWLAGGVFTRVFRRRPRVEVGRASVAFWSLGWIGAALWAVGSGAGNAESWFFADAPGGDAPDQLQRLSLAAGVAFWWLLGATLVGLPLGLWLGQLWRQLRRDEEPRPLGNWALVTLVLGALLAAITVVLGLSFGGAVVPFAEESYWGVWGACALGLLGLAAREEQLRRGVVTVAWVSALFLGLMALRVGYWTSDPFLGLWLPRAGCASALVLLLLGALYLLTPAQRALWWPTVRASGRVWGGLALTVSLCYLLVSLLLLPVKAEMNRHMDTYLAQGEIEWLRRAP